MPVINGKSEQIDPILLVDSQSARWGQRNQNLQLEFKMEIYLQGEVIFFEKCLIYSTVFAPN